MVRFRLRHQHIHRHGTGDHEGHVERVAHIGCPKVKARFYGEALAASGAIIWVIAYLREAIAVFMLEEFPFMASWTFLPEDAIQRISFFEQGHSSILGAKVRGRRDTWVTEKGGRD